MSYDFLINNGGPVIKYRTLTELQNSGDTESIESAKKELMDFEETKNRLIHLQSEEKRYDFNGVHGSTNHHLENSLPMLLDFGIKKGMDPFDELMEPILKRLRKPWFPENHVFSKFIDIIIMPFLYKAGFRDQRIVDFMYNRLDTIYNFAVQKNYDIYDETGNYKGIPRTFRNRKIINPSLYQKGDFKFPLIHDIYGLAEMSKEVSNEDLNKIETIIEYILDSNYSSFLDGYGILANGKGKYLAMGWDAKLPQPHNNVPTSLMLQRLELMAHFKTAIKHEWFQKNFKNLENYRTDRGTYILPKESLQEKKGCWVKARHMALGESRRKKLSLELESTFRVMKIVSILQSHIKN